MISGHCTYCGILNLQEAAFINDTLELLVLVAPGALCLTLWRIFVTNRSGPIGGIVSLGLDDSSLVYAGNASLVSHYVRLAYCLTAVSTFALGSLVSNVFQKLLS
jgi:hypothetical protein